MTIHGSQRALPVESEFNVQTKTLLASASRSATVTSSAIVNTAFKGVRLYLDATDFADGTQNGVSARIQGKDPVSGNFVDLPGARMVTASLTTTLTLTVYPGIGETGNETVSDVLPSEWQAIVDKVGTAGSAVTFSLGAELLK